jgi:hypothetical protein
VKGSARRKRIPFFGPMVPASDLSNGRGNIMFNISIRKVGGIYFWNVGRIGGSFFIQSRTAFLAKQLKAQEIETNRQIFTALNIALNELNA